MKAVYEEQNGDVAVFIVDHVKQTFHKAASELPKNAEVGDVFEVAIEEGEWQLIRALPNEKKDRLQSAQAKREALLKRKKNLP